MYESDSSGNERLGFIKARTMQSTWADTNFKEGLFSKKLKN
jgi:hypothetical protein